jgi:hypothetical protein
MGRPSTGRSSEISPATGEAIGRAIAMEMRNKSSAKSFIVLDLADKPICRCMVMNGDEVAFTLIDLYTLFTVDISL